MIWHFEPLHSLHIPAVIIAFIGVVVLLAGLFMGSNSRASLWRLFGSKRSTRLATGILSVFALFLLAAAVGNPVLIKAHKKNTFHLEVLLDVSDSIMRSEMGWPAVKREISRRVASGIAAMPEEYAENGTVGILTFQDRTASAVRSASLDQFDVLLDNLTRDDFASGDGTNLARALAAAKRRLTQKGGWGALVLASDGNETSGSANEVAKELGRKGMPVHVIPLEGGASQLAIASANLSGKARSGEKTLLRGSLRNNGDQALDAGLSLNLHSGRGGEREVSHAQSVLPGQWARFRWPVTFSGSGLQFVDMTLEAGREKQKRRFYTQVVRPPKCLSIGGDHSWANAFSKEEATVVEISPEALGTADLQDMDAVVIGGVSASRFARADLERLANLVESEGKGLFLINGFHRGPPEQKTVLMSYIDTPLENLLPVSSRPRPFNYEPPSRQVVILIDNSGSMGGRRMQMAKEIALHIVANLLREKDKLDLITFSTGANHLIRDLAMNDRGKNAAVRAIQSIFASGGTDPANALELIGNRKMEACGLIFISDGGFDHLTYRPDCRATVFAIDQHQVPKTSPLWELADPFPVPVSFEPGGIEIPYFEPDTRDKYFEQGEFRPLDLNAALPRNLRLPVSALPISGAAISYLREDALLNAVRPKFTDPVLAYRDTAFGSVGVFTSGLSPVWVDGPGRENVKAWIERILPFTAGDRYQFQLEDLGDFIEMKLSLTQSDPLARIAGLNARIFEKDGGKTDVSLAPHPTDPGVFLGRIQVERKEEDRHVLLEITESGPDASARPQRIPLVIPRQGEQVSAKKVAEAFTHGSNRELLARIARHTGGLYDPPQGSAFLGKTPSSSRKLYLWPHLSIMALFCYLLAIVLQRWDA